MAPIPDPRPPEVVSRLFTCDASETNVHTVDMNYLGNTWPFFKPNFANMEKAMEVSIA